MNVSLMFVFSGNIIRNWTIVSYVLQPRESEAKCPTNTRRESTGF